MYVLDSYFATSSQCQLRNNSAQQYGGVAFAGSPSLVGLDFSATIAGNRAALAGAVAFWADASPWNAQGTAGVRVDNPGALIRNNSAAYGPWVATGAASIAWIGASSLQVQPGSTLSPLTFQLLDQLQQLIVREPVGAESVLQLQTFGSARGTQLATVARGWANFSGIVVLGAPGAQVELRFGVLGVASVPTVSVYVQLSDCAAGFGYSAATTTCVECAPGTVYDNSSMPAICTACGRAQFSDRFGALTCSQCPMATYADTQGLSACKTCPGSLFL